MSTVNKVSVVLPCLNEEGAVAICVHDALAALKQSDLTGEVIVVDNGSTDRSVELARDAGARVITEPHKGYGRAYMAGFAEADGDVIVMADADCSYDFKEIPAFVEQIRDGADLVVGNRMAHIHHGAMPWHRRRLGNPVLSWLLNRLFDSGIRDAHCGLRALRRDKLQVLDLQTTGMQFASEMIVRATREQLDRRELPIQYLPRVGSSKLKILRDGWLHLRYLLLESPSHLFIRPGALVAAIGSVMLTIAIAPFELVGRHGDLPLLIAGSLTLILGAQIVALGLCASAHQLHLNAVRGRKLTRVHRRARLEHGLTIGLLLALVGVATVIVVISRREHLAISSLLAERLAIISATMFVLGVQIAFSSCLVSILTVRRTSTRP